MSFQNRLNYSLGNETWEAESSALDIRSSDRVLCVTASGDRALHLLLADPSHVVSIDINPIQNHLLELKMAAVRDLDYTEFLSFIGVRKSRDRLEVFRQLEKQLSSSARAYWRAHQKMIAAGIIYQGKTERYCLFVAIFFKIIFAKRTRELLAFSSVGKQAAFVDEHWDTPFHRWIYNLSVHMPKIPKISVFDDPGLHAFVDPSIDPGRYMYERKNSFLKKGLARKSLLIQLIYNGGLIQSGFPAYLREENFDRIRNGLSRISIVTDELTRYMANTEESFDVFSLSDVASYIPYASYLLMLQGIQERASSGARFCIREYMTRYGIPDEYSAVFIRDVERENRAKDMESNFVYEFCAGTIR